MPTIIEKKAGRLKLPSNEQIMVEEFSDVIRRHQAEDPASVARSMNVAFSISAGKNDSRRDKMARAYVRGLEARQQLSEAEGGSLSSEETARLLGISKTAVLKRLDAGRLLAWREERLQAARFPVWQFDENGRVLSGFEEALAILNGDERLNAWGKALFFLEEKSSMDGERPLDWLRAGKVKEVCVAAHAYAE